MSGYTHVHLKDVENMAEKHGLAPDMEARFATRDLGLGDAAMSYQRLAPAKRSSFGHRHGSQEELYVFISGSGRAKLDDDIIEVKALDALRIAPQTVRALEAGPDGLEMVAFGAPQQDPQDTEMIPGWWTD